MPVSANEPIGTALASPRPGVLQSLLVEFRFSFRYALAFNADISLVGGDGATLPTTEAHHTEG